MTSELTIAIHALVYLCHRGVTLSSEELADNVCTHPVRIRKVMAKLKKAGLVEAQAGNEGGYRAAESTPSLTLACLVQALEAPLLQTFWHSGDPEMECLVASGMASLMDSLVLQLNRSCLEQLEQIRIQDFLDQLFGDSSGRQPAISPLLSETHERSGH